MNSTWIEWLLPNDGHQAKWLIFINIGLNNYVTLTIKDCGVLRPSMVSTSLVTCGYSSPSLGTWMGCELGLERLCGCTIEPSFHWLALKAPWSKLGSSSSTPHLKNLSKIKVHLWRSTCDIVNCWLGGLINTPIGFGAIMLGLSRYGPPEGAMTRCHTCRNPLVSHLVFQLLLP